MISVWDHAPVYEHNTAVTAVEAARELNVNRHTEGERERERGEGNKDTEGVLRCTGWGCTAPAATHTHTHTLTHTHTHTLTTTVNTEGAGAGEGEGEASNTSVEWWSLATCTATVSWRIRGVTCCVGGSSSWILWWSLCPGARKEGPRDSSVSVSLSLSGWQ